MQNKPHTASPGRPPPRPASPEVRAARNPARGPLAIASDRAEPSPGTAPILNQVPASSTVVTRIVSKPHPAPRFVVQLCQSARPIEPNDVPQLDLFELYHLYRDSKSRDGEIRHSLRLGYFKDPAHAQAVAAYLAPHFRHPRIVQIDVAEIISSLRLKFLPGKDIGASGQHAAIVLSTPLPVPTEKHQEAPMLATNPDLNAQSLWAWLLKPLRRFH